MPEEVRPGLFQLKVPIPNNPLEWVLPYLIPGADGCTLVDSGWNTPDALEALEGELREIGFELGDIKRLLITHVHPDHYGLAGRIHEISGAMVIIHQRERDLIRSRYLEPGQLLERMAAWLAGHGVPKSDVADLQSSSMPVRQFVVPAEPDAVLWGGETIDLGSCKLEVFWTPGHSPGHVCFYEREQRFMLTGDHVLPTITPNVSLNPQQLGNPLGDYLASLQRLEPLEVDDAFPAHEYAFKDLRGRLGEIVRHHEERLNEMFGVIGEGRATAYEVASGVVWTIGTYDSFSPWMRRAALSEALAHLEYAVCEGMLHQTEEDGIIWYQKVRDAGR